jgi:hypothetical protein
MTANVPKLRLGRMPAFSRSGLVAVLLVIAALGCEGSSQEKSAGAGFVSGWRFDPAGFRTVMIRANGDRPYVPGNSLEGIQASRSQGIPFVEMDLLLTKDSMLVAAHDSSFDATCGLVIEQTLEDLRACAAHRGKTVATVDDLLSAGFHETFLDLKVGYLYPELNEVAVGRAIRAIEAANAQERTVVMLYAVTPEIATMFRDAGIRGGTKGYPETPDEILALVDLAAMHGLEMMCSEAQYLRPDLVAEAAARNVWLLPWDLRGAAGVDHARELATAGIGGLIVRDIGLTDREIRPSWRERSNLR